MTIFWITLFSVYILGFCARTPLYNFNLNRHSLETIRPNKVLTVIITMILVLVAGLRSNIGDTGAYKRIYIQNNFTLSTIEFSGDFGFDILQAMLQKISSEPQILIFTTALITNALIIIIVYKYTKLFELSLFFYITSGIYLVTMNGIRQYLAASIIFLGTPFLLNRDWKKYFLLVLLASTFHNSALILIPTYFFVNSKAWKPKTFFLLGAGIILAIIYQYIYPLIYGAAGSRFGEYQNFDEGGANILRVLVTATPIMVAYLGRKKLEKITPLSDIMVNMSILGLFFMILSLQNWIFARMAIYYNLYQIILISWLIDLFAKRDQKIVYVIILFCFLFYFYYEHVIILNVQYRSDFFS